MNHPILYHGSVASVASDSPPSDRSWGRSLAICKKKLLKVERGGCSLVGRRLFTRWKGWLFEWVAVRAELSCGGFQSRLVVSVSVSECLVLEAKDLQRGEGIC